MLNIIGASGFIGQALTRTLEQRDIKFQAFPRNRPPQLNNSGKEFFGADIGGSFDFRKAFEGTSVVINAAGTAHFSGKLSKVNFKFVNVTATKKIAEAAASAGVKRFVHISTIKVNGEYTRPNEPFSPMNSPAPSTIYGMLKYEAELELMAVAERTGMELTILRPPAVYGQGMKGNMANLFALVKMGMPLPFALINNRRSLIFIENLVDLLILASEQPAVANKTYLVCDGFDVSTPDLIIKISQILNKKALIFPINPNTLINLAALVGKHDLMLRLCDSLQIDNSAAISDLRWLPRFSIDEGLKRAILTVR